MFKIPGWHTIFLITLLAIAIPGESYILSRPIWDQYVQREWNNFEAIAKQIDVLKYTVNSDCPVGTERPITQSLYRRSLLYFHNILAEARVAFEISFAKLTKLNNMKNSPNPMDGQGLTTAQMRSFRMMLQSGWDRLWPMTKTRNMLKNMDKFGTETIIRTMAIAEEINALPGWEDDNSVTDKKNIDDVALFIDTTGAMDIGGHAGAEEIIVIGGGKMRSIRIALIKAKLRWLRIYQGDFRGYQGYAKLSMANPALLDLLRHNDPKSGAGEEPFTYAELLGKMVDWYGCWMPELQELISLIERLGPLPGPEQQPRPDFIEDVSDQEHHDMEVETET
ncbi:hypothetical protein TWF281_006362 [Arthrobotrys megalospora]